MKATRPLHLLALATAIYAAAAILFTWPLLPSINSGLIGYPGDNLYFLWVIGWFQKAVLELQVSPLLVPSLNYPAGYSLAYNEFTPASVLLAWPVTMLAGPVVGYNVDILMSFVLSGLGVYWWSRRLTQAYAASIIAGFAFAFGGYRLFHISGHLNLMGTQWLPLYFMSLDRLLRSKRWSARRGVVTALFLGLIALTSQYYLYMTVMLSLVYIMGYLWIVERTAWRRAHWWQNAVTLALAALPLLAVAEGPYLQLASLGGMELNTSEVRRLFSASLTDFLIPSLRHPLWGWIANGYPRIGENQLYLGMTTIALAAFALWKRSVRLTPRSSTLLIAFAGACAFVLASGTELHWMGQQVEIDVPSFLQGLHPFSRTFIPLPGYFLFKYLPFYGLMRVWMRYGILVSMFVSLLAGIGGAWLFERVSQGRRPALLAALLIILAVELYLNESITGVARRPVDDWLAAQPGQGAVAALPIDQALNHPELVYYLQTTGKPFVGGYFGAFQSPQFRRIQPALKQFPDAGSIDVLRQLGVQYVLLNAAAYPDIQKTRLAITALGMRLLVSLDGQEVYGLPN